jgi:hypothetical protein
MKAIVHVRPLRYEFRVSRDWGGGSVWSERAAYTTHRFASARQLGRLVRASLRLRHDDPPPRFLDLGDMPTRPPEQLSSPSLPRATVHVSISHATITLRPWASTGRGLVGLPHRAVVAASASDAQLGRALRSVARRARRGTRVQVVMLGLLRAFETIARPFRRRSEQRTPWLPPSGRG